MWKNKWWLRIFHLTMLLLPWKQLLAFDPQLLAKASALRDRLPPKCLSVGGEELVFPSTFSKSSDPHNRLTPHRRGFCNWIVPGRIMVGQYPGQVPEVPGPSEMEVYHHLSAVVQEAGVTCFVCLQSELPAQDDWVAWQQQQSQGRVYLDPSSRRDFPRPFTHYAPIVDHILQQSQTPHATCTYIHWPIDDLSTPPQEDGMIFDLLGLLLSKLLETDQSCLYIHCWGGRGRAGLTAACLLSLLYPDLDSTTILDHVQQGYDSRSGADQMPYGLRRSPQTEPQRQFVREFVKQRRLLARS